MKLVFASNNQHKLDEIKALIGNSVELLSLNDIGFTEELPETTGTIVGNAIQKAKELFERTGLPCFADDSGLEVEALGGAPGVDSAYYAGPERDSVANYTRLLHELRIHADRSARFVTVISLVLPSGTYNFEGEIKGTIADVSHGNGGFGYDPVFIPEGYDQTFAELPLSDKNEISHRARAVKQMADFLESLHF